MKAYVNLWYYLAKLLLEWEIFQAQVVQKIKTHILCTVILKKNRALYEIMWKKYGIARQATDDNIIRRMRIPSWITMATHTHTHTHTHTQNLKYLLLFTATVVTRTPLSVTFIRTFPVFLNRWTDLDWTGYLKLCNKSYQRNLLLV
jgi:hypothetical protein